ncbi:MAG: hypothetical protein QNJ65_20220 [Xenococcaceae cyanobacterium MO_234.B1]|nr:hypothetical protein [Xenococcaceae cyanobacterium MO_234.B1]
MNNQPKNLVVSEQLPNDGGWHWDRLVTEANHRLSQIGKHGKRAKIKVTPKPGKPISAQFSLPSLGQKSYGLDLPLNRNNLVKAEEYCQLITTQLVAGTFTKDWFYSLIGKDHKTDQKQQEKILTCKEMIEQYKIHYFRQRENNKAAFFTWKNDYRHIESALTQYDKPITLQIIRKIIEATDNNTPNRTKHINGLVSLLKYFDNNEFKSVIKRYKTENNPKPQKKYIPDDGEIMTVYNLGFIPSLTCAKKYRHRYLQWKFLYSLLAIYGLRVHEAWNIKNWDKPVTLKDGDWLAIADDTEKTDNEKEQGKYIYQQFQGKDLIIPAILDPNNKDYLLCIGHETKTGYRIAFPISPLKHDWIQEFNLLQPLNLPDTSTPSKGTNENFPLSARAGLWFRRKKYGFTPHALRHAYNIRGHNLGINQKRLADSLGHSLQMNSSNYLKHESDLSKLQGIKQAITDDRTKRNELEQLREENTHLKAEVEKLRTKLVVCQA